MTLWIITRTLRTGKDGMKLTIWDSDTGMPRSGYPIGYVKSQKVAESMLAYYRRYGSKHYNYKLQGLDMLVTPKERKGKKRGH